MEYPGRAVKLNVVLNRGKLASQPNKKNQVRKSEDLNEAFQP